MKARPQQRRMFQREHAPDHAGLRAWLLGGATAIYVAQPLVPGDAGAEHGYGLLFVMLWIVLAGLWVLDGLRRRGARVHFDGADMAMAMLVAWHSASALVAVRQASPRPAINVLWEWVGMGAGFFMMRQLVATQREARAVLVTMIALAVTLSGVGYYQYFHAIERDRLYYEAIKDNPQEMMRTVGHWYPPGSPERMQFENRLASDEPTAMFALTNSLAGFLAPWLIVALGLALSGCSGKFPLRHMALPAVALALPIAGRLLFTKSRSGMLAVLAGIVLLAMIGFVRQSLEHLTAREITSPLKSVGRISKPSSNADGLKNRPTWRIVTCGAIAVLLVLIAVSLIGALDSKIVSEAGKSLGYRGQYWRSTLAMIRDHPWFGCGPGQFQHAYTIYKLPEASEEIRDPHNFLLEVWSTAGTPAALALLAVLILTAWRVLRARSTTGVAVQRVHEARGGDAARLVLGGGFAGLGLAMLAAPLAGTSFGLLTAASCAVLLGASMFIARPWLHDNTPIARLALVAAAALGINLLAAGGIGSAGVAGTLWLLLALALNEADNWQPPRQLTQAALWSCLGALVCLGLFCYFSAHRPVLQSRASIARSYTAEAWRSPNQREEHLLAAVREDPLSDEAAGLLANYRYLAWVRQRGPASLALFEAAVGRLHALAPRSSAAWSDAGEWWKSVYEHTRDTQHLQRAIDAHSRAVQLYPTSARHRALYTLVLDVSGQHEAAAQQASTGLRLDATLRNAGHQDKLLSDSLREQLERIARGDSN